MLASLLPALQSVAIIGIHALLPPRCECNWAGDPCGVDQTILAVLQRQLDRCGPEELRGVAPPQPAAPVACPEEWGLRVSIFAVGGLVGVLAGLLLRRDSRRTTEAPAFEPVIHVAAGDPVLGGLRDLDTVSTPSSRRRLAVADGSSGSSYVGHL